MTACDAQLPKGTEYPNRWYRRMQVRGLPQELAHGLHFSPLGSDPISRSRYIKQLWFSFYKFGASSQASEDGFLLAVAGTVGELITKADNAGVTKYHISVPSIDASLHGMGRKGRARSLNGMSIRMENKSQLCYKIIPYIRCSFQNAMASNINTMQSPQAAKTKCVNMY